MKKYADLWKNILFKPSEGLKDVQHHRLKELTTFLSINAAIYAFMISLVNIALIFITGAAARIPANTAVFFAVIFAGFFIGLLLVILVYSLLAHVLSLAFVRGAKIQDSVKMTVAAFTPIYIFTWLSPVFRAGAFALQPAMAGNGISVLVGQIVNQTVSVLFGSFSIWLIWALIIQLFGFMHFQKAPQEKAIPFILICSVILLITWNLLASLPLALMQALAGF